MLRTSRRGPRERLSQRAVWSQRSPPLAEIRVRGSNGPQSDRMRVLLRQRVSSENPALRH